MARARNIKPSFFQNEELGELSAITRLAFIGMWTIADYKGCIEFRPKRLKVQIMPYDDCDFEKIANDLDKSGLIAIYTVAGQRYIKIINFEKHQNPHKNERESGSEIPDMDANASVHAGSEAIQKNPEENGTAPADSLLLNPSSLIPESNTAPSAAAAAAPKYSALDDLVAHGVDLQTAKDWLAVRKAKKAPPTKTAIEGVYRELSKAGMSIDSGIRLCCERGWAGFNPAWIANTSNARPQASQSQLGKAGQATAAAAQRLLERAQREQAN